MTDISTTPTPQGILRAVYGQQTSKAYAVIEEMAKHFWPMIGTANQVAYLAIDEAVEAMTEAGMMKHMVKVHANNALKEYKKYERAAWSHYHEIGDDRYGLWQDLVGRAADKLQPDINRLLFAIKNVIDRAGVRNSMTLARIQAGLACITLSTLLYDTMVEKFQRMTTEPLAGHFAGGRLTAVENHWKAVGELTGKVVMADVNLRDDETCQLGIRVLLQRYEMADFLNEASHEALQLNPQVMKYLKDDEQI